MPIEPFRPSRIDLPGEDTCLSRLNQSVARKDAEGVAGDMISLMAFYRAQPPIKAGDPRIRGNR